MTDIEKELEQAILTLQESMQTTLELLTDIVDNLKEGEQ